MGSDRRRISRAASTIDDFNPRSRMGSDWMLWIRHPRSQYFNPRSRMGSDLPGTRSSSRRTNFNPRSRMGSDRRSAKSCVICPNFNPRSRMGSDDSPLRIHQIRHPISIHAPAWGATAPPTMCSTANTFQSTLPHGERPVRLDRPVEWFTFQSTLPHGERLGFSVDVWRIVHFNPRSRMGSDCC